MKRLTLLILICASYAPVNFGQFPTEVEKSDGRVDQIIARAEVYFREGEQHLKANEREQARQKFDKAVDTILESGLDVRASPRLQSYYSDLVERIYREEVATTRQPKPPLDIGFHDQVFQPSPLDQLSKLVLTPEEQQVSQGEQKPPVSKPDSVITGSSQKGIGKQAPSPCSLTIAQSPVVRGLKLEQSHDDLGKILPQKFHLLDSKANEIGLRRETLSKVGLLNEQQLSGVTTMSLWYFDDRLVSIQIYYDATIPWQSNLQFTAAIVEQLRLPKVGWKNRDPSWLICDGFFIRTSSAFSLLISRGDLADEIDRRIEANRRKRRAEFKP